ncbi:unnamed protein product [Didymodactylos carnosus]|uniref:Uncharacterized protein n=1 Tax=Didymodactylos carnosus TaxID=1234261 RepID=A0A813PDP5_9BILA|nr:unnamed protein product [Didymodactylos carnosus]CAF0800610.1 unnamed protein product [Didymodactylos carnosus]CAF3532543.1 unnamed protein product [Didymodactylos carnosus]CAF3583920.1 unnamed protein product [Didymodactylos carnosus]
MTRMVSDHPPHHHLNMYKSPGLMMQDHPPMNGPPSSHGPMGRGKMSNHHPSSLYPVNSKLPPDDHMQRLGPPHHQQFMHMQQDDMFSIPPNTTQNQQPQLHPHENRPAAINNTYVNATMSIAQLNIQNLGPGLQPGTIHLHHQTSIPHGDPMFAQQYSSMNNEQPNGPFGQQFNDMCPPQESSAQPPPLNSQNSGKNMQQTQQNTNSNNINTSSQSPLSGQPPMAREKNVQIEPQGVSTIRYKPNSSSSRNRSLNPDIDFLPPPSPQIPSNQNSSRLSKQQQQQQAHFEQNMMMHDPMCGPGGMMIRGPPHHEFPPHMHPQHRMMMMPGNRFSNPNFVMHSGPGRPMHSHLHPSFGPNGGPPMMNDMMFENSQQPPPHFHTMTAQQHSSQLLYNQNPFPDSSPHPMFDNQHSFISNGPNKPDQEQCGGPPMGFVDSGQFPGGGGQTFDLL